MVCGNMAGKMRMGMFKIVVMGMAMRGFFHRNMRHDTMPLMPRHGRKN